MASPEPETRTDTQAEHEDREEEEERFRPAVEELGGQSEYSLEEAHRIERGSTRRHTRGAADHDRLIPSPDPDELGRRYLEGATQTQVEREQETEEPVVLPSDEPD